MKAKEITAIIAHYDTEITHLRRTLDATNKRFDKMKLDFACAEDYKAKAAEFDKLLIKYAGLEQLHEAAITGFKSDTELMQAELDVAKKEATAAKQEVIFFRHAFSSVINSLACVTVDAVAHCNGENKESLRTFIGLVKEHVVLSIQDRVQLDAMLANLEHDF